MRSKLIAAVLTAGIIALAAPAAGAAEPQPDGYTPHTSTPPSLAGSSVSSLCGNDVPWINFSVQLTDPDDQVKTTSAYLLMKKGSDSVKIPLGTLVDDKVSGSVLWPGATVDDGVATGWPGWEDVDGVLVETGGNFGWTREGTTTELHVNPELIVPLSYPAATAACAGPTAVSSASPSLAMTGGQLPYLAMGIGATALVAGVGAVLIRRRRTQP